MIYYLEYNPYRWEKIKALLSIYIQENMYNKPRWDLFDLIYYYPKGLNPKGLISNCNIQNLIGLNKKRCESLEEFINFIIKDNMKREFTKEDLKSGMVVKTRTNEMYLVVEGKIISDTGFMYLNSYNMNLKHNTLPKYDIIEVHNNITCWGSGFSAGLSYVPNEGKLIWKREEVQEFTMQEIADKLGIPVEQLRIKK